MKYSYKQCHHKATTKGDMVTHKTALHEGVKCSCKQCDDKVTSKVSLGQKLRKYTFTIKLYFKMSKLIEKVGWVVRKTFIQTSFCPY